jgi:hypothetical protein
MYLKSSSYQGDWGKEENVGNVCPVLKEDKNVTERQTDIRNVGNVSPSCS